MKFSVRILAPLFLFLSLASCLKKPDPDKNEMVFNALVLNRGASQAKNASLTLVDERTLDVRENVYREANGVSLNATGEDMLISSFGLLYVLCSSPDKVEMIDPVTFESLAVFSDSLKNARSMDAYNDRLFVVNAGDAEDAGDGKVTYPHSYMCIYDMSSNKCIDTAAIGRGASDILCYGTKAYVTTDDGIAVMDLSNSAFVDGVRLDTLVASEYGVPKNIKILDPSTLAVSYSGKGIVLMNTDDYSVREFHQVPVDETGRLSCSYSSGLVFTNYTDFAGRTSKVYSLEVATGLVSSVLDGINITMYEESPVTKYRYSYNVESYDRPSKLLITDSEGGRIKEVESGVAGHRMVFYAYSKEDAK